MEKLNTTSEWDKVVNANHQALRDAEFEEDLQMVKAIINRPQSHGRRSDCRFSRFRMLASCMMALTCLVAIIVLLETNNLIPSIAMPACMISLLLAGFLIGWHACAAIIGKGK